MAPQPQSPPVGKPDQEPLQIAPELFARHNGGRYGTPDDLEVTPSPPARFLVIGGCLAEFLPGIASAIDAQCKGDFLLLNNFDSFPELPSPSPLYDFQIVLIPLRSILGSAYFRLPDDGSGHEAFLRETEEILARYLGNALKLNRERKLPTFVMGLLVPQQNPLGRFQPRYDLRNIVHFIERLNVFLAAELAKYENVHFVDADAVSAGLGKKYCQDDMVWSFTHGTSLSNGDHEYDRNRIQPVPPMAHHYTARWIEFLEMLMREIFAMRRSALQLDSVKLVAVDLDDTLWRGVAAEGTLGILEGWPMGFMETLLLLKKRGVLLAIVSKNDERFIEANWDGIVQGQIALDDFAIRKINFQDKAQNLAAIIRELNLLPQSVVMVDDNPVERAAIREQLPSVRVLGSHPYYWKRILLWSPETQRPSLTQESLQKTEQVRAQLRREAVRQALSHEEFLQTLNLGVSVSAVGDTRNLHMSRALELLNKTNQFNSTGARYTLEQCHLLFAAGQQLYVIHAEDRFTRYGLIGAAWVREDCVEHIVLSCRALGLGIEEAFLACIAGQFRAENRPWITGRLVPTQANLACRQLYSRSGFTRSETDPTLWSRPLATPFPIPAHVRLDASSLAELAGAGGPVPR